MAQSSYEIGAFRFAVRTTSHAFDAWLQRTLVAYRLETELDDDPYYNVVVGEPSETGRAFHILYRGTTAVVRSHDLTAVVDVLLADLEYPLLVERDDAVYLEASALRHDGVTGLVSGSLINRLGKLGPRIRRGGIELPVATSWTAVGFDGLLVPTERRLVLAPSAADDLADVAEIRPADERFEVTEPTAARFVATTSPRLERGFEAQVQRGTMLRELAGLVLNLPVVRGEAVEALGRMLEQATVYEYAWTKGTTRTVETLTGLAVAAR